MLDKDLFYKFIGEIILKDLRDSGYVEIDGVVSLCYRRGKDVEVWEALDLFKDLEKEEEDDG